MAKVMASDGVSATSTTSAFVCTLVHPAAPTAAAFFLRLTRSNARLTDSARGLHVTHRPLYVIVPCDVLQGKSVIATLRQKCMAESMDTSIRIDLDFTTEASHLGFQNSRL